MKKDRDAPRIRPARSAEDQQTVRDWRARERDRLIDKMKQRPDGAVAPETEDIELFAAKLSIATGNDDYGAAIELIQLAGNCIASSDPARKANLVIAEMQAIGPRDGVEGMLAAQMVATHHAALHYLSFPCGPEHAAVAVKLLRTFAAQTEALGRYRNGGKQQVIVQHQHVAVNAQQAAVAINAPQQGREGEPGRAIGNDGQPHAIGFSPIDALRGEDASRDAMPVAGDAERSLPDARRRKSGRADGRAER